MSTMSYFEEPLYTPGNNGLADKSGEPTVVEVIVSNFFSNHQVYLQFSSNGECRSLHLTKDQAKELAEALSIASRSIAYDNTDVPNEGE
ncbi:hypothetical protein Enr13x_28110 [Stieleria neptunia]|uniref:Uncharacterized protein n=1 Tax=Stieleria neptunia TaxID=2527979 RepID=A0A518HQ42_9BACT|nr:hypothetical protein Enr13x_28110 [Stieleria neptunia]